MSSIEEDIWKIMNKAPFTDLKETFDPATDSLEAIRDAIDGIEAGVYTYCSKSGPTEVEINDGAEFSIELLNPGDAVIPADSITPGTYKIERIRDNVSDEIVAPTTASKADGRIYCTYQFTAADDWQAGDLFKITFSGGHVTIGGTTTAFPEAHFYGRIVRDEAISDKIGTPPANLGDIVGMLGNPDAAGKTIYDNIGDFKGQNNLTSLLEALGIPDVEGKPLYTCIVTDRLDHAEYGLSALHGDIGDKGAGVDVITRLGAFDGDADAQGDIFRALGVPTTNSLWSAVRYIHHEPVSSPTSGSIAQVLVEGIYGRANAPKNLHDLLGVPDDEVPNRSIYANLGDFQGQTNLKSLLAVLGSGWNTDNRDIYNSLITDRIGSVGDAEAEAGTILQRLTWLINGIRRGAGATLPADKSLYDAIGPVLARGENPSLYEILGVPDEPGKTIYDNLGDFMANNNLKSLKDVLAVPDTAGKGLFVELATDRIGAVGDPASETGTLLPRLKFYGEGIIRGTGTPIPPNKSLYDAIGDVLSRDHYPSLTEMLGLPNNDEGSLYERLGAFTRTNNLKALLGDLTPTNNLYDILGGYTTTDTLKDHIDPIKHADISLITLTTRSMADYIRGIGINVANDGFDSSEVTANEDGSIFERLEHLKNLVDDKATDGTHDIEVAHGTDEQTVVVFKAHRTGKLAVQLDLNALVEANEGGTVTVRLKHMIDNTNRRTIDLATFVVGTDEIHPTVSGWVDAANDNGVEVTIQCSSAVTATRTIPYKIMEAA